MSGAENTNANQYLTFVLHGESYAIPIEHIREVLQVPKVTRIPCMPDFMYGVINLRGTVVPILDLKLKFGLGNTSITVSTAIIVIEIPVDSQGKEKELLRIGVFADSVQKVITLMPEAVEPPPQFGIRVKTAFISGMGRVDDAFTVILNIRQILSDEDITEAGLLAERLREEEAIAQGNG